MSRKINVDIESRFTTVCDSLIKDNQGVLDMDGAIVLDFNFNGYLFTIMIRQDNYKLIEKREVDKKEEKNN